MKRVAIIGGGASGMMAAITAAMGKCEVTVFEKNERIGQKILKTGNGKCNFTNENLSCDKYYCDDENFINDAFERFNNEDLVAFFTRIGMLVKNKNGYIYPASEQASTVLDVLRREMESLNIKIETNSLVNSIQKTNDGFKVIVNDKDYNFDKVIVACGGLSGLNKNENNNAYKMLENMGIEITQLYPALTQIYASGMNFASVKGCRCESVISVISNNEFITKASGELLFTDYGLSGIVTFQISHLVEALKRNKNEVKLLLDFLPGMTKEELKTFLCTKELLNDNIDIQNFLLGVLNKKLNIEVIKKSGLAPSASFASINENDIDELVNNIKEYEVICERINDFSASQVTAGGVRITELDKNFMVKKIDGLYVVGELMDVDGLCGGYNLQWAFTTGYIAGEHVCC